LEGGHGGGGAHEDGCTGGDGKGWGDGCVGGDGQGCGDGCLGDDEDTCGDDPGDDGDTCATVNGTMARSLFFDNAIPTALRRRHPLRRRRGRAGGAAPRCNASGKQAPRVQTLRLLLVSAD